MRNSPLTSFSGTLRLVLVFVFLAATSARILASPGGVPSQVASTGVDDRDGNAAVDLSKSPAQPSISEVVAVNGPNRLSQTSRDSEHRGGSVRRNALADKGDDNISKSRPENGRRLTRQRPRYENGRRRLQNGDPTDLVDFLSKLADTAPDQWSGEQWAVFMALLVLGVVGLCCCTCMCLLPMCCGGQPAGGGGGCLQDLLMCFCCWELCCRGGEDIQECCGGYQGDYV